ncbi:MAG: hypothetical protein HZA63_09280 [Rhodocyclales bacterium]|nr:hypothetical protein [Rhodocyclales bacterium]
MIDTFIATGALGPPQTHHQACLSRVTYSRFSHAKAKPTTTFIGSPMTGAQIDLKYWVEHVAGVATAFAEVRIPLASATVGNNYAHAGLASIGLEVKCGALLTKITLTALGFTPDEVACFMETTAPQQVELTWHTATASKRARLSAQRRTKDHFDAQRLASGRHDVGVADVHYEEGNGKPGLLVELKGGDLFRQYGKAEQVSSRTLKIRTQRWMSEEARKYRPMILAEIEDHVRNEVLVGNETLRLFGAEHPSTWTAEKLKEIIDYVWKKAGLAPEQPVGDVELSPEVEVTWQRYLAGKDLVGELPPHTFRRHRALIKAAKGDDKDIAIRRKSRAVQPGAVGRQQCYDRRTEPAGELRKTVLCEVTAPAIIEELQWGLDFLETGKIPDSDDGGQRAARWIAFAAREGGRRHAAK